jgi:YD repeat-containing protein
MIRSVLSGPAGTVLLCALLAPRAAAEEVSFTCDGAGKLVSADFGNGTAISYRYDGAGNLLSAAVGPPQRYPLISGISQESAPASARIVITGTGFLGTNASATVVKFNGVEATIVSLTDTRIAVVVPAGAASGPLTVTTSAGTAASGTNFVVSTAVSGVTMSLATGAVGTTISVGPANELRAGYTTLAVGSGTAPYGTAVFSYTQNGAVVSEAGVPASPPTLAARFYFDSRTGADAGGTGTVDVFTGFAAVNRGTAPATLRLTLRDASGATKSAGSLQLAQNAHMARFLHQLAPDFVLPQDFATNGVGSLEITSNQPVSVLALRLTINQRQELLLTSTPVADLDRSAPTGSLAFPQIADGGGYRTTLVFMNTSGNPETGTVRFFGGAGAALPVRMIGGGAAASEFAYTIQPGGVVRFVTDGSPSEVHAGWAQLVPAAASATPVGAGTFSFTQGGTLVTESGVPSATPTTHARIYVDTAGGHNTGLAVVSPEGRSVRITATAYLPDGVTPAGNGPGTIDLVPGGHLPRFVGQLISGLPEGFTGVLDLVAPAPFAALTLRSLTNERGDFLLTTFPIADVTQVPPAPVVFPQIADGGGYQTQIILLNTGAASSVTLSYLGADGRPITIGQGDGSPTLP